jgi:hypothetical protein
MTRSVTIMCSDRDLVNPQNPERAGALATSPGRPAHNPGLSRISDDGHLRAFAGVDIDTGGRAALDEQLNRLRSSTADPGLLIGTAKDLLCQG